MRKTVLFLLLSAVFTSTSPAFAGLLLSFEDKGAKGEPSSVTLQLEGKKLRVEKRNGGTMIFDGDQQKLWSIDTEQRSYSEITEADAERIREAREKMEAQMKEQMGRMSPEQRMQMEEMMEKMKPANEPPRKLTFEAIGGRKKTGHGFSCQPYKVMEEGKAVEETCFIPWKEAGLSIEDFQAFEAFEQFLRKIGADTRNQNRIFHDLKQSPGIPAHVAVVDSGQAIEREQTLTALKRDPIPPSRFVLPEGLQKRPTSTAPGGTVQQRPPR